MPATSNIPQHATARPVSEGRSNGVEVLGRSPLAKLWRVKRSKSIKRPFAIAVCLLVLAVTFAAQAQGILRGANEGAYQGNRAAGPIGAPSMTSWAGHSVARSARSMEPSELIIATIITIYNRDYRRDCR